MGDSLAIPTSRAQLHPFKSDIRVLAGIRNNNNTGLCFLFHYYEQKTLPINHMCMMEQKQIGFRVEHLKENGRFSGNNDIQ